MKHATKQEGALIMYMYNLLLSILVGSEFDPKFGITHDIHHNIAVGLR